MFVCGFRAAKERKKPDRVVFECQERAYWVVHRPPVRIQTHTHTQIVIRLVLHTEDTASAYLSLRINCAHLFTSQGI